MQGRLTLLETSHRTKPLRTQSIEGLILQSPKVGDQFVLVGDALDSTTFKLRMVKTSQVQSVEWVSDSECRFQTENSWYQLDIITIS